MITVAWLGKPVWVLRRTPENLKNLTAKVHRIELLDPDSQVNQQPDYAKNDYRSIKEELFVAVGICTHLVACRTMSQKGGQRCSTHCFFVRVTVQSSILLGGYLRVCRHRPI